MEDDTPVYDLLFQMEVTLSDRFPSFTPLSLRRERAREVFTLITRYNRYAKEQGGNDKKKSDGKQVIRRRASDDAGWW